ncbi:hypothetical protein A5733_26060 [Mycobacterium sp. NS-7484]|uniref:hypothetical protein n=1 Tax=Mycobacterium sp. NS-7484 TaxID=1834161 RepID=UPI00096D3463|nr:hypothetical protein [Mycobacterium sp. NS-7484]OMC02153.1 hypothetical protein A5733_26060 [Mycobacterium sp. NS-7484]
MSSPDRIADHHKRWDALPPFPGWPYVMTDGDVEAWGDILYMRALVDEITNHATPRAIEEVLAGFPTDADSPLTDDWPHDDAADLLAAWRVERQAVAA